MWASDGRPQERQWRATAVAIADLVPLPQRGAALDVGEEEGDGAGGEIGHDPLQRCGLSWSWPIVARGHRNHAERLTDPSSG